MNLKDAISGIKIHDKFLFFVPSTSPLIEHARSPAQVVMAKWLGPFNAEGKEHGRGVHVWDDGDRAEGEFVNGLMQGWCADELITDAHHSFAHPLI